MDIIPPKRKKWYNTLPDALIFIGGDVNIASDNNLDRFPPRQVYFS